MYVPTTKVTSTFVAQLEECFVLLFYSQIIMSSQLLHYDDDDDHDEESGVHLDVLHSWREMTQSRSFIRRGLGAIITTGVINLVIEWGALTSWGSDEFSDVYLEESTRRSKVNATWDMLMTCFMQSLIFTVQGANNARKALQNKEHGVAPIEGGVHNIYVPTLRFKKPLRRGLVSALVAAPTFTIGLYLILAYVFDMEKFHGLNWTIAKAVTCMIYSAFAFCLSWHAELCFAFEKLMTWRPDTGHEEALLASPSTSQGESDHYYMDSPPSGGTLVSV